MIVLAAALVGCGPEETPPAPTPAPAPMMTKSEEAAEEASLKKFKEFKKLEAEARKGLAEGNRKLDEAEKTLDELSAPAPAYVQKLKELEATDDRWELLYNAMLANTEGMAREGLTLALDEEPFIVKLGPYFMTQDMEEANSLKVEWSEIPTPELWGKIINHFWGFVPDEAKKGRKAPTGAELHDFWSEYQKSLGE